MKELLGWAQSQAKWAFWLFVFLRIATFLAGSSATVVVAFGLPKWAPLIIAAGTTLTAVSHELNLSARLQGLNDLIGTIRNNVLYWQSATIIEKRLPHVRANIITKTEEAFLSMTSAWTGGLTSAVEAAAVEEASPA